MGLTTAAQRLKNIEALLPSTYYAGVTLEKRIEKLVRTWKNLLVVVQEQELSGQAENTLPSRVQNIEYLFEAADKYFIETGKSFWALDPVCQKKLLESIR